MSPTMCTPRLSLLARAKQLRTLFCCTTAFVLLHLSSSNGLTPLPPAPFDQRTITVLENTHKLDLLDAALWGDTAALSVANEGLLMTTVSSGVTRPFPGTETTSLLSSCGPLDYNEITRVLWVGNSEGLWRYQQGTWSLFRHTSNIAGIADLVSDSLNGIWVLTTTDQLFYFDGVNWTAHDNTLLHGKTSELWLSGNHRSACWILRFNRSCTPPSTDSKMTQFECQRLDRAGEKLHILHNYSPYYRVAIDTAGAPWVMHYCHFDSTGTDQRGTVVSTLINDSLQLHVKKKEGAMSGYYIHATPQNIYVFARGGLYRIESDSMIAVAPPLFGPTMEMHAKGFYTPKAWSFDNLTKRVTVVEGHHNFSNATIRSYQMHENFTDTIWSDTLNIGWKQMPGQKGSSMVIDKNDTLWVGMPNGQGIAATHASVQQGLWKTLRLTNTPSASAIVSALAVGPDNTKWAICGSTLYSFVNSTHSISHPVPPEYALSTRPTALTVSDNGVVWIAAHAHSGLLRYNLVSYDGTQWKTHAIGTSTIVEPLLSIAADNGGIWALMSPPMVARISLDGQAHLYSPPSKAGELRTLVALSQQRVIVNSTYSIFRLDIALQNPTSQWGELKILEQSKLRFPLATYEEPLMLAGPNGSNALWVWEQDSRMTPLEYVPAVPGESSEMLKPFANAYVLQKSTNRNAIRHQATSASGTLWVLLEDKDTPELQNPVAQTRGSHVTTPQAAATIPTLRMQSGGLVCTLLPNSQVSIELFALNGRLLHRQTLHNPGATSLEQRLAYERPVHGQCLIARLSSASATGGTAQVVTSTISAGALR